MMNTKRIFMALFALTLLGVTSFGVFAANETNTTWTGTTTSTTQMDDDHDGIMTIYIVMESDGEFRTATSTERTRLRTAFESGELGRYLARTRSLTPAWEDRVDERNDIREGN